MSIFLLLVLKVKLYDQSIDYFDSGKFYFPDENYINIWITGLFEKYR